MQSHIQIRNCMVQNFMYACLPTYEEGNFHDQFPLDINYYIADGRHYSAGNWKTMALEPEPQLFTSGNRSRQWSVTAGIFAG